MADDVVRAILEEIGAEREEQLARGYTREQDDKRADGVLADTAAAYATTHRLYRKGLEKYHALPCLSRPVDGTPRRCALIMAAALLVAEIERLDRAGGGAP